MFSTIKEKNESMQKFISNFQICNSTSTELKMGKQTSVAKSVSKQNLSPEPDWGDANEDFDKICDDDNNPSLGNISNRPEYNLFRSILGRVLMGGGIGQLLPIWVFERRSLLEVYGGFFAHPDEFVAIADFNTPEERFMAAVKFYLHSMVGLGKHEVARKPYNPLLGEIFRCRWTLPEVKPNENKTTGGPFPGSSTNQLTFLAEQVSHHPPVSAIYAEYPEKRISYNGSIWTKVAVMQYFPPSIGAYNIGQGSLRLHALDEEYLMDFPSAYGRDITSTPWVEYGGKVKIKCVKTGYKAVIQFKTYSSDGKKHRIEGYVFRNKSKVLKLHGEWNGTVNAMRVLSSEQGKEFTFSEASAKPLVKKECESIDKQGPLESRRVWRHVTAALYHDDYDKAQRAKEWLSVRQREEASKRSSTKTKWTPKYFTKKTDVDWKYTNELGARTNV